MDSEAIIVNSTSKKLRAGTFTGNTLSSVKLERYVLTETFHTQNENIAPHTHELPYLSILLQGSYAEQSVVAQEDVSIGSTLIRTHDFEHKNKIGVVDGLCFNLEIENELFKNSIQRLPKKYLRLDKYDIQALKVYSAFKRNLQSDLLNLVVEESLYNILYLTFGGRVSKSSNWIKKVQDMVRDLPSAKFEVDQLANSFGLHPVYFVRKFKETSGVNFSEFVINQRLSKAIELMHHTRNSLTEISIISGFYDQSHFIRRFRERFNITPSQYLKLSKG